MAIVYKVLLMLLVVVLLSMVMLMSGMSACRMDGAIGGNGASQVTIRWPVSSCVPLECVREGIRKISQLGFLPQAQMKAPLNDLAQYFLEQKHTTFRVDQLESLRDLWIISANRTLWNKVRTKRHDILKSFNDEENSISQIAHDTSLPALMILRVLLRAKGLHPRQIQRGILHPESLPAELRCHSIEASGADYMGPASRALVHEQAKEYEMAVERHLRKMGVLFRTEDDLRAVCKKGEKLVATPDFLLEDPIRIDSSVIHWIEVKDYFFYFSNPLFGSLKKQVNKYEKLYGSGAVLFGRGMECNSRVPGNVLLLDGSHIER
jgi:hypothetical protein